MVDNNVNVLKQLCVKGSTSIIPVTGQTVTASSFHENWTRPDHVFDGKPATQWVIANGDTNPWIQVQFPNAVQLYRIILHPRLGNATLTHKVTSSALYGSNDGINYVKVMESNEHVDKVVTTNFNITRPYSYFKLEMIGNQQFGLSRMEMFESAVRNSGVKLVVGGRIDKNTNNELQLDQNVYQHSTILGNNWTKFLPVAGSFGADYRITDSGFTVPNTLSMINIDIDDKLCVDGNFAKFFNNPAFTSGFVPMVFVNPLNNYMSIRPRSGIRLNCSGHFVDAKFGNNIDADFNNSINLINPVNANDGGKNCYVDHMTSYVSGGGIPRNSGQGLRVDNNVHLFIPGTISISTHVKRSVPVIGVDNSTGERYISDSHFTMPNFGHVPTINTDVVN